MDEFAVTVDDDGRQTLMIWRGELGVASVELLSLCVTLTLRTSSSSQLVIDFTDVTFVDSSSPVHSSTSISWPSDLEPRCGCVGPGGRSRACSS